MRLRHYLRGLGLGIIVSTLIISAGRRGSAAELTDEEIKTRAKALGMVEEDDMLLSAAKDLATEAARADDERKMALSEESAKAVSDQTVSGNVSERTVSSDGALSRNDPGNAGNLKGAGAESALESGGKSSEKPQTEEIKPSENNVKQEVREENPGIKKEEVLSDAGRGSTGKAISSSDKKTGSSSDKKTSSSSDKKTGSSSDGKTSSSSDKKTETPAVQETPENTDTQPVPAAEPAPAPSGAVTIVKGESSTAVAKKLQQAGFVTDAMQFDQYLCLNGYDRHLVTGTHSIPAGASARDIAEIITSK